MPKVGKRTFAYTSKGRTAAKRYASKSGKSMSSARKKKKGSYA